MNSIVAMDCLSALFILLCLDKCLFSANGGTGYFNAYVEKVAVGSQTESDKDKEHLQDMVTAFQMQNKFLNKVSFISGIVALSFWRKNRKYLIPLI